MISSSNSNNSEKVSFIIIIYKTALGITYRDSLICLIRVKS